MKRATHANCVNKFTVHARPRQRGEKSRSGCRVRGSGGQKGSTTEDGKETFVTAVAVGLLTGCGVVGLNRAVEGLQRATEPLAIGNPLGMVGIPSLGGMGVGILKLAREELPEGLVEWVGAVFSLGTRNSLGPEGPSVSIGRTSAKVTARLNPFAKWPDERSTSKEEALAAAGAAAGIAGGFGASVSGAFFAIEAQLQGRRTGGLGTTAKVLLAAVVAGAVSRMGLGERPAFSLPEYELRTLASLPLYLPLGLFAFGVAVALSGTTDVMQRIAPKGEGQVISPVIGGASVGMLSLEFPKVLYLGFANFEDVLELRDAATPLTLASLLGAKVVATAISRSSGLYGGLYAPSLFMGACVGACYGLALEQTPVVAQYADSVQAYAIVGMAACLGCVCRVPLTAILLTYELTRDYGLLLPLMSAVGVASLPQASLLSLFAPLKERERPLLPPLLPSNTPGDATSPALEGEGDDDRPGVDAASRLLVAYPMAWHLRACDVLDSRFVEVHADNLFPSRIVSTMAESSAPCALIIASGSYESRSVGACSMREALEALTRDPDASPQLRPTLPVRPEAPCGQLLELLTEAPGTVAVVEDDSHQIAGFVAPDISCTIELVLASHSRNE